MLIVRPLNQFSEKTATYYHKPMCKAILDQIENDDTPQVGTPNNSP